MLRPERQELAGSFTSNGVKEHEVALLPYSPPLSFTSSSSSPILHSLLLRSILASFSPKDVLFAAALGLLFEANFHQKQTEQQLNSTTHYIMPVKWTAEVDKVVRIHFFLDSARVALAVSLHLLCTLVTLIET